MSVTNVVPNWVRIVVGLLAVANILYGISGYFDAHPLFQNSLAGIDIAGQGARFASFEFAARNLAIGLALMIVALKGVPESIAIVNIIRALVEIQTVVTTIATGHAGSGTLMALAFLAVEVVIIVRMVRAVSERDARLREG